MPTTASAVRRVAALAAVVAVVLVVLPAATYSKNIHVTMGASWSETSLLSELCEAVAASVGDAGFFTCVSAIPKGIAETVQDALRTPRDHSVVAQHLVDQLIPAEHVKALVRTELVARVYSPKVEAHRQLAHQHKPLISEDATTSSVFAVLANGAVYTDIQQAIALAQTLDIGCNHTATEYSDVDHVFPGSSNHAANLVILYGDVASQSTIDAHRLAAAAVPSIRYIFRHATSNEQQGGEWDAPVALQGYGVTLDVKNMEYKAVDEKKKPTTKSGDVAAPTTDEDDTVIGGFNIAKLKQRKPSLQVALSDFATELADNLGKEHEDVQLDLQVWELQQLGFQAAMHVLKAKKPPMEVLLDLLGNFPLRAGKISKFSFNNNALRVLQQQLAPLQRMFGEGANAVFLNGRGLTEDKFDFFAVLSEMRKEEAFLADLERMVLYSGAKDMAINASTGYELAQLLHRIRTCQLQKAQRSEKRKRIWFDQARITWVNDMRTSPFFADAGTSLKDLFRQNYYGQPVFPRRNIFHAVYLLDPSKRDSLELVPNIQRFLASGSAARIGFFLVDAAFSNDDERHYYATAFNVDGTQQDVGAQLRPTVTALISAVVHQLGDDSEKVLAFLMDLLRTTVRDSVSEEQVEDCASRFLPSGVTLDQAVSSPDFYEHYREQNRYAKTSGIRSFPVMLFNGILVQEGIEQSFFQVFQQEFQTVRDMISREELRDDMDDIYEHVMTLNGALRRYQPAVFDKPSYLPLKHTAQARFLELHPFVRGSGFDGQVSLLTHVLVLPRVLTSLSIKMVHRAISHLDECKVCPGVQLTLAACSAGDSLSPIARILEGTLLRSVNVKGEALQTQPLLRVTTAILDYIDAMYPMRQALKLVFTDDVSAAIVSHLQSVADLPDEAKQALYNVNAVPQDMVSITNAFCEATATTEKKLTGKEPFILTNGRRTVFDESFALEDFLLLELDEAALTNLVYGCIETVDMVSLLSPSLAAEDVTKHFQATKITAINSILRHDHIARGPRMEKLYLPYPTTPYSFGVNASINPILARHTFNAVLNPVARESQHIAALVAHFATIEQLSVSSIVFLNPPAEMQKIPINNFYQLVAQHELKFDSEGAVVSPGAYFKHVPQSLTLTLGLVEPEAWMVFASSASQDLDNIRLETLSGTKLKAEYTLKSILLTGSCHDVTTDDRPRGLPIVMTKRVGALLREEGAKDTLVMSNFGYFQLQGNPGVWHLAVQPGVADSIYEVIDVEEKEASALWAHYVTPKASANAKEFSSSPVAITSFTGKHVDLRVQKRPGMEQVDLLETLKKQDDEVATWPPVVGSRPERPATPTLNIFSVASGHLYERFMRMMIHTVMKSSSDVYGTNTTRIKFWLIENFLSPKFKELIPRMSTIYGFDYGFVTYRWPHWLRRQTEKQRTIWGYKILFLDVLFPLEVEKVIYVDADQVVRADLHDLYNLDLSGHAVAYTPFCRTNANPETKGFRFWDQGFWSDHLRGKPYHISAIYVVDLKRLRRMAAGDQYRMIYENLSADPNSLSNLDQDLPNFAQHQVPIFSLPEEWLWCETWCNQNSKSDAKTIDLCNNPLTKTPKLENAKRIIPEWEATDAMIEELLQQ